MAKLLGWTSAYTSGYQESPFTEDKKQALIECVRRRHYYFTYNDLCFLSYCAPIFGKTVSIPSRKEWNEIINAAYAEIPITNRLTPFEAIKRKPINDILYEKMEDEPKGGEK